MLKLRRNMVSWVTYASLSKDEGGGALFMMGNPDSGGLLWHDERFVDF